MTAAETEVLHGLCDLFTDLQPQIEAAEQTDEVLTMITHRGLKVLDGAEHAAITRGRPHRFETVAETSELPLQVDSIQYELQSGPCVDAILDETVYRTGDLQSDERWPVFGRRAVAETGVLSMLSFRMFLEGDDYISGLNFYSSRRDSFTDHDRTLGLLLSTHGALAQAAIRRSETVNHLRTALQSNREIGIAMGILMATHKVTREQAFDLLRIASQHSHRKLAELAIDVADAGTLDLPQL